LPEYRLRLQVDKGSRGVAILSTGLDCASDANRAGTGLAARSDLNVSAAVADPARTNPDRIPWEQGK